MKPRKSAGEDPQGELFKSELRYLVDERHSLVKLAAEVDWGQFEKTFGLTFDEKLGRPGIPTRLMVALHYLKYSFDLSDELVVQGWVENPYWQFFSGEKFFQHELPIDPSSMTRWRKRVGEAGAEELLRETIQAGLRLKLIKPTQLQRVNVDTTVQEKNVRFPTDARLLDRARERWAKRAQAEGIELRQSDARVGKRELKQQSRYAHAKQFKRAGKSTKKLKTILGRVIRDVERKAVNPSRELSELLVVSKRIFEQQRKSRNKVYSVHEPGVECISKGKAHKRYEFGCKVSLAATSKGGWLLAAKAHHQNPYDGHTLAGTMAQLAKLSGREPEHAFVDMGYRGHGYDGECIVHVDKRRRGRIAKSTWKWMKRRSAIEPTIGHLKSSRRLDKNRLKGALGDQMNVIMSAAGMNLHKILKDLAGTPGSLAHFLRWLLELLRGGSADPRLASAR